MADRETNGPGREEILAFLEAQTGRRPKPMEEADLFAALDIDGDDGFECMEAFADAFKVDMAGFEWAFHHMNEGRAFGVSWPIKPAPIYGVRIPLSVSVLIKAAQTGVWPLRYPAPQPTRSRGWINMILILFGLPVIAALLLWAFRTLL